MPQPKAQFGLKDRPKITTIPPSKKKQRSFFEEYYYGVLAVEFLCVALLFVAGGMGFYRGILIGLLVATLTAVVWQVLQYARFRSEPAPPPAPLKSDLKPIRPAGPPKFPVGPDGKKIFPPNYFPPLKDRKQKK
jgi:hypothetical protein